MWIFWTIVLFVVGLCFCFCSLPDSYVSATGALLCCIALSILIINIFPKQCHRHPTALDVYRGNTELRITSVNGVPTDTVVVFKNK